MFDTDDWDLDQDFLNDVDDKSIKYLTQKDNEPHEPKRRKIEKEGNDNFESPCDMNLWSEKPSHKIDPNHNENKLRNNLILGLFNKALPEKIASQGATNDVQMSYDNATLNSHNIKYARNCENTQLPRKKLVLGILKKKNSQDNTIENNMNNKNVNKSETESKSNDNRETNEKYKMMNNIIKNKIINSNCDASINLKQNSYQNSGKELLFYTLKQQCINNIQSRNDVPKNKLLRNKVPQAQPSKKMTLVRKFPGPAGLLPDNIDGNISCVSYLDSLEESENTKKEPDTNNLTEYCSQTTKNLFTEGAWKLMLDDLPNGFLKGYDIVTAKQMATLNGSNSTKVKFLAGIIEHIDFCHDNPPIILKDFTDTIQGIVHRDIPFKYPGLLEANVILLLHDVGLLRISGTFASNKYQILISPSSLLAIYTNKGVVERTQQMELIFKDIAKGRPSKEEEAKRDNILQKLVEVDSLRNGFQFNKTTNNDNRENSKNNKIGIDCSINLNDTHGNKNESLDFYSDISFSVSPTKIADSQNEKNFNNSLSKYSKRIKDNYEQKNPKEFSSRNEKPIQNYKKELPENLLKNLKKFIPDRKEKKHLTHSSRTLSDAEHSRSIKACPGKNEFRSLDDEFFEKTDLKKLNLSMSSEVIKSEAEPELSPFRQETEVQQKRAALVRSKLLQFKSADALTLPEECISKKDQELSGKKFSQTSIATGNILGGTENNSDDDMLSQLDMDTIFSNYNEIS